MEELIKNEMDGFCYRVLDRLGNEDLRRDQRSPFPRPEFVSTVLTLHP
jgi:hypothetical protein